MRDPDRIDRFCDRLKEEWKKVPELRFGQFLCNVFGDMAMDENVVAYFVGDRRMLELIRKYADRMAKEDTESHI